MRCWDPPSIFSIYISICMDCGRGLWSVSSVWWVHDSMTVSMTQNLPVMLYQSVSPLMPTIHYQVQVQYNFSPVFSSRFKLFSESHSQENYFHGRESQSFGMAISINMNTQFISSSFHFHTMSYFLLGRERRK